MMGATVGKDNAANGALSKIQPVKHVDWIWFAFLLNAGILSCKSVVIEYQLYLDFFLSIPSYKRYLVSPA